MIKIQTKEHLVYFMQCGMMKLSNYDLHFVQNLYHNIGQNNPMTSNQELLLDKLIEKYKKQFSKHSLSIPFLKGLSWGSVKIIESSPEFTEAFIEVKNNKLLVKCPFSKKFIADLRKYEINPFEWNKEHKRYEADYGTLALKIIYNTLSKNYPKVNYCPITESLLNIVSQYNSNYIWEPTLMLKNGYLLIGASNELLDNALKNIELNLELSTLTQLSQYGIKISDEISANEKLKFAGNYFYETSLDQLDTVLDWLKEIKCDCVFFSGLTRTPARQALYKKLENLGIDYFNHGDILFTKNKSVSLTYDYIVNINFMTTGIKTGLIDRNVIKKTIKVNNSYPITIK